jgi:hypothetical protein
MRPTAGGVNLFVVVALGLTGAAFVTGEAKTIKLALVFGAAVCAADWLLVKTSVSWAALAQIPTAWSPSWFCSGLASC